MCLEAGAWNISQAPPGNTPQQLHLPSRGASVSGGWTLLTSWSHSCLCPGLSTLLDASLVFTFLLPLFLCQPHSSPSAFGYILKRLGSGTGEALTPDWRGWEGF